MVKGLYGSANLRAVNQGQNSQYHHLWQDKTKCRNLLVWHVYGYEYF